MDDIREIKQDVKEVKATVGRLSEQMAVMTHIINEHEKRSTTLEKDVNTRLQPLEDDYKFNHRLVTLMLGGGGILGIIGLIVSIIALKGHL